MRSLRRSSWTTSATAARSKDSSTWRATATSGSSSAARADPLRRRQAVRVSGRLPSLDPVTGRPDVDPEHKPMTGKRADFCPGVHGGKNWPPIAFSPRTRMIYIPANNNLCGSNMGVAAAVHPGQAVRRHLREPSRSSGRAPTHVGEVQAWNVDTGQKVWTHIYEKSPNWGGMLVDGWRRRLQRRHERSQVPRVRRRDRQAAVGVPDELRHAGAADVVHGRWQAVRRRRVGLGRRLARHAGDAQSSCSRASIPRFPRAARSGCSRSSRSKAKVKGKGQEAKAAKGKGVKVTGSGEVMRRLCRAVTGRVSLERRHRIRRNPVRRRIHRRSRSSSSPGSTCTTGGTRRPSSSRSSRAPGGSRCA